jgi:hypothetical protein
LRSAIISLRSDVVRSAGILLFIASTAFWVSWLLMPGVGVTDTARIFWLVGQHRPSVFVSVVLQLLSAAAYVPAIQTIVLSGVSRGARAGSILLVIGAIGSAADAIFHLVAFEMTAQGIPADVVAPVMRRLQGPDLLLLLPFVAAFFVGHALLIAAMRGWGRFARYGAWLLVAAPGILVVGVALVRFAHVPGRVVGLSFLGAVAGSLAMIGLALAVESDA